ncbi:MAG: LolC/E family lipoprotein releasing system, transrane protein [Candidatus Saccharibacteria bacterium]|nr:LolC/E family lipoprotein releasing system, transrane protein [Candidatus Saccharibacteria bacterium]
MIRFSDAALLALTKLRTRKVRTIVTVITASLLFGTLVLATLLVGGVVDSAKRFTKDSLSERYITNVQDFSGYTLYDGTSPELQARANEMYIKLVADKKREAARLGAEYDSNSEQKPTTKGPDNISYLDLTSPAAVLAIREHIAALPPTIEKLKTAAAAYHPKSFYEMKANAMPGEMTLMVDGVEKYKGVAKENYFYSPAPDVDRGWSYLDASITNQFLLDSAHLDAQKNIQDLPIIAPYSKVEAALGLKKLPKSATSQERLERSSYIRKHAASATFTACYRNAASQLQIGEALRVAKEIEQNKTNKEYQKPSLIYGVPAATSCGPAIVSRDVRTADEKKQAEKQLQFDRLFDSRVDPVQQKVTFRVVGLGPDGFSGESFSSMSALVSAVAGSSLQGMWVVPQNMYDALPNKQSYAIFDPANAQFDPQAFPAQNVQLVEFTNVADAKAFSATGCTGMDCGNGKPFISYFGSNSILLAEIISTATKTIGIAVLIVGVIAALILMGMIGRVIGDSRRETAVFRAIGAQRNDIRMIYTIYTIALSLLIALVAVIIGVVVALWIDHKWATEATAQAQVTFVGVDGSEKFRLAGIWWSALWVVVAAVIVAGLVSMLLPLSRNLARSPIKDMRDDT